MNIRNIAVIQTGKVRIHPQQVEATGSPMLWWLFTSRQWTQPMPINAYVIEHDKGLLLFDTGQDRHSVTDADYFPGGLIGLIYKKLARFSIGPEETLTRQLEKVGYSIGQVRTVVLSHLHQDHIGGLPELAGPEIIVSQQEYDRLRKPLPELDGLLPKHIDMPGLNWKKIACTATEDASLSPFAAAYDMFGDGAMVLLPTPGHTAGSISLFVRQAGMPPMLFVGDATYEVKLLADSRVSGIGKRSVLLETTRLINGLKKHYPNLVILPAHDPAAEGFLKNVFAPKPLQPAA